jgi:hypothetical protein
LVIRHEAADRRVEAHRLAGRVAASIVEQLQAWNDCNGDEGPPQSRIAPPPGGRAAGIARGTANVVRVTEPSRGGHFVRLEEPEVHADELRAYLRLYRAAAGRRFGGYCIAIRRSVSDECGQSFVIRLIVPL